MEHNIFRKTFDLSKKAFQAFQNDDPFTLAGALAYFTIFAIPPLIVVLISTLGYLAGEQTAQKELFEQIRNFWGEDEAKMMQNIVTNYAIDEQSLWQKIFSIAILVFSASTFFVVIQSSLNQIWEVKPKPENNILKMIRDRVVSFIIILVIGALMVLSIILESLMISLQDNFDKLLPGVSPVLFAASGYLISFFLLVLMFAIIYKFLPDAVVEWKVVWVGATLTAFLFTVGRIAISFYLTQSDMSSAFGVAGSFILILLWIFYSAVILFFGAEITQQYALYFAQDILPKEHAVKIKEVEIPREEIAGSQASSQV